jgi:hypothetical protein
MKKTFSILLVILSFVSTTVFAESALSKNEGINSGQSESSNSYYTGRYLLRKGERIELDPQPKLILDGQYSGKYRLRQGQRIDLNPQPAHVPNGQYSGKYILRKGMRIPS